MSGMPFCVTMRPSREFEPVSKILALRPAVVSGRGRVSPVSTKVIVGLHNIKLESFFPNVDSPMREW